MKKVLLGCLLSISASISFVGCVIAKAITATAQYSRPLLCVLFPFIPYDLYDVCRILETIIILILAAFAIFGAIYAYKNAIKSDDTNN